jgi:hypothetical protein
MAVVFVTVWADWHLQIHRRFVDVFALSQEHYANMLATDVPAMVRHCMVPALIGLDTRTRHQRVVKRR